MAATVSPASQAQAQQSHGRARIVSPLPWTSWHDDDDNISSTGSSASAENERDWMESVRYAHYSPAASAGTATQDQPLFLHDSFSRERHHRLQLALPTAFLDATRETHSQHDVSNSIISNNSNNNKYLSTGTTICAVRGADFVVLGADTRATAGTMVADTRARKIHPLAPNCVACGAGTSADLQHVTRQARYSSQLQQQQALGNANFNDDDGDNNADSHVPIGSLCRWLQETLYEQSGACQANLIVGGVYQGRASLASIYPHGSMDSTVSYTALGSGGLAATAVLERGYTPNLTREQAVALVRDAVLAGIRNDLGSGSQVDLCVIGADGSADYQRGVVPEEELAPLPKLVPTEQEEDDAERSMEGVNGFGNLAFRIQSKRVLVARQSVDEDWNEYLGIN